MGISENGHSNLGIMSRTVNKNIIQGLGTVINNSVINGILGTIIYLEMEKAQGQYNEKNPTRAEVISIIGCKLMYTSDFSNANNIFQSAEQ